MRQRLTRYRHFLTSQPSSHSPIRIPMQLSPYYPGRSDPPYYYRLSAPVLSSYHGQSSARLLSTFPPTAPRPKKKKNLTAVLRTALPLIFRCGSRHPASDSETDRSRDPEECRLDGRHDPYEQNRYRVHPPRTHIHTHTLDTYTYTLTLTFTLALTHPLTRTHTSHPPTHSFTRSRLLSLKPWQSSDYAPDPRCLHM